MFRRAGNLSLKAAARHPAAEIFHQASRSNLNPSRHRQDSGKLAFFSRPKIRS